MIPKNPEFDSQDSFNENHDEVGKIFVEKDIFGLEKQKPGSFRSGIAPYKLLIGVLFVFLIIFMAYVVTNLV